MEGAFVLIGAAIGMLFAVFLSSITFGPSQAEKYMNKCREAGGIPAITARGPDVCLNPSAVIKGVE
jgi:hypothetical protein